MKYFQITSWNVSSLSKQIRKSCVGVKSLILSCKKFLLSWITGKIWWCSQYVFSIYYVAMKLCLKMSENSRMKRPVFFVSLPLQSNLSHITATEYILHSISPHIRTSSKIFLTNSRSTNLESVEKLGSEKWKCSSSSVPKLVIICSNEI